MNLPAIDATHDASLRSWVASANGHEDFPVQNLPFGVFSPLAGAPRGGVAIGDAILDLRALHETGLLHGLAAEACRECARPALNAFLALGAPARQALRTALSDVLREDAPARPELLHDAADAIVYLPAEIGDYTDFYAGLHHATNVGRLFRPDAPLLPNYKHVPIGYHGRASSVVVSGTEIRRPQGQIKAPDPAAPVFAPSARLDYELELGLWMGPGNAAGARIGAGEAARHIAGYCLLNDWSARDVQAWEYQPLGPFLAKSFGTTISPWIVTPEALAPFRTAQAARPEGDPKPLPYLWDESDQACGALKLELEVLLSAEGASPQRLSLGSSQDLYWTPAQMVAHHTSNGCNLRPGDLFGSGTISGQSPGSFGSLLELTQGGKAPVMLEGGVQRTFLQDGDEIIMRARARRDGFATIGFGDCRGRVLPALG